MENKNHQLLSIQEASKILGIKPITLRKWDRENKLKSVRVGIRGDRKYYKNDLMLFLGKSQEEKIKWSEYVRSGATLHHTTQILESLHSGLKKHFGCSVDYQMTYFESDTLYWYYNVSDLYRAGKIIVNKLIESEKNSTDFFAGWNEHSKKVIDLIEDNDTNKIKKLSEKKMAEIYKKFDKLLTDWYGYSICIDATDETLMTDVTDKTKNILKNKLNAGYSEKEFARVYNILTSPSKQPYTTEERILSLDMARDVKNKKINIKSKEAEEKIDKIIKRFWWTNLGWARDNIKSKESVIKNINEIIKSKANIDDEIEKIKNYEKQIKKEKDGINYQYDIDNDKIFTKWLSLTDKLVEYHDFRKEVQMKANYWNYQFFEEIARRKKIPVILLDWCEPEETIDLLINNKFNETELNLRSGNFLQIRVKDKIRNYSGKEASRKRQENLNVNLEKISDIQGICASGGKAAGEAFVAVTIDTALKIKEGQILVTGMTTPEFLPAMKKAKAIVTDEGGITCHAAIVSREFGIPCIVGTKYATKLLKNNDLIEVKANHGVVRIIKK